MTRSGRAMMSQEARNSALEDSGSPERAGVALQGTPDAQKPATGRQTLWLTFAPNDVATLSPNARSQSHWPKTGARRRVMLQTKIAVRVQGIEPPGEPVSITFRWIVPTRATRDIDNLAGNGTVKGVIDALVRSQILVDDSTRYVVAVNTAVEHRKGERWLEVVLKPLAAARSSEDV